MVKPETVWEEWQYAPYRAIGVKSDGMFTNGLRVNVGGLISFGVPQNVIL